MSDLLGFIFICILAVVLSGIVGITAEVDDEPQLRPSQQYAIMRVMDSNAVLGMIIDPDTPLYNEGHRRLHAAQTIQMWQIVCAFDSPDFDACIQYGCELLEKYWPETHEWCEFCQE